MCCCIFAIAGDVSSLLLLRCKNFPHQLDISAPNSYAHHHHYHYYTAPSTKSIETTACECSFALLAFSLTLALTFTARITLTLTVVLVMIFRTILARFSFRLWTHLPLLLFLCCCNLYPFLPAPRFLSALARFRVGRVGMCTQNEAAGNNTLMA